MSRMFWHVCFLLLDHSICYLLYILMWYIWLVGLLHTNHFWPQNNEYSIWFAVNNNTFYDRTTVFSHAHTSVICSNCQTVLCTPTGGKARLTEGCNFRRKTWKWIIPNQLRICNQNRNVLNGVNHWYETYPSQCERFVFFFGYFFFIFAKVNFFTCMNLNVLC